MKVSHEDIERVCADHIVSIIAPVMWSASPGKEDELLGSYGTAFLVQTKARQIAITADHVYRKFLDHRDEYAAKSRINNLEVDLEERLIARNGRLDIATFDITSLEAEKVGTKVIYKWPPIKPLVGMSVMFAGFPVGGKELIENNGIIFEKTPFPTTVTSVNELSLTCQIELAEMRAIKGKQKIPEEFNVAGMSGGPVFALVNLDCGLFDFAFVGVVSDEGMGLFKAARADFILEDGQIKPHYLP